MIRCTLCDKSESEVGPITPGPVLHGGHWAWPLGVCQDCVAFCRREFDLVQRELSHAEKRAAREARWPKVVSFDPNQNLPQAFGPLKCTFCGKDRGDVAQLMMPCAFFVYVEGGREVLQRVAHIKLFLMAKADKAPRRVFDAFICDECIALA